jgi:hypothetical protein
MVVGFTEFQCSVEGKPDICPSPWILLGWGRGATEGRKQGRQEGRKKGRQEGRKEGYTGQQNG